MIADGEPASAADIAAAVAAGRLTAAAVLADHLARHRATHGRLNALVQTRHEQAAGELAGVAGLPLGGVPVSVKECFPVHGMRTTLGIPGRDARDEHDAEIVVRLKAAGAVVVGKANVPQAMWLHETDNPVWGRTNHPTAAGRGPGGSSGGDAALVAAGVVPLAVGTDLAGSIRQPAHACGIAGLVPRSTVLGEGGAFDTQPHLTVIRPRSGFLARTVADLVLAYEAIVSPGEGVERTSRPLRIGWWDDAGVVAPSAAIRRGVREAVSHLAAGGCDTQPVDGCLAREAASLLLAVVSADGGADIRRLFDGVRPMPAVGRLLRLAGLPRRLRPGIAAACRLLGRRIEAEALLATGPRGAAGREGLRAARAALAGRVATLAERYDALVCPVSAVPALVHGTAATLLPAAAPCMLANLLDLAAGAVPVTTVRADEQAGRAPSWDPVTRAAAATDHGSRGLPVGVQVIALSGGEATVLTVMRSIEAAAGFQTAIRATSDRAI
ncbi:MAG: amidase family protein [Planctomycetia bacterium]